jgi:hypothetical protein
MRTGLSKQNKFVWTRRDRSIFNERQELQVTGTYNNKVFLQSTSCYAARLRAAL